MDGGGAVIAMLRVDVVVPAVLVAVRRYVKVPVAVGVPEIVFPEIFKPGAGVRGVMVNEGVGVPVAVRE